jgi:hypothetical protein
MTTGAALERQSRELDDLLRPGGAMAFFASCLQVRAGEWKPRLAMVEVGDTLPSGRIVAALAIRAQLAVVCVAVASGTLAIQAKVSPIEVLYLDLRLLHGRNVLRRVAARAGNSGVLALQSVPGLCVVELLQ